MFNRRGTYVSPFVADALYRAELRARRSGASSRRRGAESAGSVADSRSISTVPRAASESQGWDSSVKPTGGGLFDSALKKQEIFRLGPRKPSAASSSSSSQGASKRGVGGDDRGAPDKEDLSAKRRDQNMKFDASNDFGDERMTIRGNSSPPRGPSQWRTSTLRTEENPRARAESNRSGGDWLVAVGYEDAHRRRPSGWTSGETPPPNGAARRTVPGSSDRRVPGSVQSLRQLPSPLRRSEEDSRSSSASGGGERVEEGRRVPRPSDSASSNEDIDSSDADEEEPEVLELVTRGTSPIEEVDLALTGAVPVRGMLDRVAPPSRLVGGGDGLAMRLEHPSRVTRFPAAVDDYRVALSASRYSATPNLNGNQGFSPPSSPLGSTFARDSGVRGTMSPTMTEPSPLRRGVESAPTVLPHQESIVPMLAEMLSAEEGKHDGALLAQAKLLENTARIIESMSAQLSTARGGRGGGEGGLPGDNATMRRRRERKRASRTWMDRPVLVNVSDSGAIRSISAGIMPLEGEAAPRRRSGSRKKRGGKEATNNRPLSKAALFDLVLSKLQALDALEQDIIKKLNEPIDLEAPMRSDVIISKGSGPDTANSALVAVGPSAVQSKNAEPVAVPRDPVAHGPGLLPTERGGDRTDERHPSSRWPNFDLMQFMDGADVTSGSSAGLSKPTVAVPRAPEMLTPVDREIGLKPVIYDTHAKASFRKYIKERDRYRALRDVPFASRGIQLTDFAERLADSVFEAYITDVSREVNRTLNGYAESFVHQI